MKMLVGSIGTEGLSSEAVEALVEGSPGRDFLLADGSTGKVFSASVSTDGHAIRLEIEIEDSSFDNLIAGVGKKSVSIGLTMVNFLKLEGQ